MAGSIGSNLGSHAGTRSRRNRSLLARVGRPGRRLSVTGPVIVASAAIAIAMLPLATPASAQGTWTVILGAPSGATTTGFLASGTVTPDGEAGFAQVVYEPSGTPITSSSPTAGLVTFNAGVTTPQAVSIPVDQLAPNTSYTYELQATEDDDDAIFDSAPGTVSTTASPTGPGTPVNPPNNPSANGIFGQCSGDPACVNDTNGVRAAQEQLPPLVLPTNWSTLTGPEQMFVWTDLERTSRAEVAIPNLVDTYNAAVQAGLLNDADPSLSDLPGNSGSIWAGAYATVLGAMYGWLYDDGPGGENADCTGTDTSGCWGHRDNILADANTYGNPTEMDAGVGTDSGGNADYDAIFVVNPNATAPANIVFTWAEEQPFLVGSTFAPSISGVTLSGTPAAPTVTVTGSNFGSAAPTATPETCQAGDTGNDYGIGGLEFQDLTEGWGAGESGDCIGLLLTSWSSTKVVFTFGNEYANYGPISAGDEIEVTVQGTTDTVPASFSAPTVSKVSPNTGSTAGGTAITITGTGFVAGATVVIGQGNGAGTGAIAATSVKVVSATEITAVTGGGAKAGAWSLFVTTSGGTSAANTGDNFTYTAAAVIPTVSKVSPNTGSTAGGTAITITGTGFVAGATVVIGQGNGAGTGAIAATSVKVVSATEITAVTGGGAKAGAWSLFVTTSGGTSAANTGDNFTYTAAAVIPTVSKVSPNTGSTAGGTAITITGTGFVAGATVVIGQGNGAGTGAIAATSVKVVSATEITAVTGGGAKAGAWSLFVTTSGGTSAANTGDNFTYT